MPTQYQYKHSDLPLCTCGGLPIMRTPGAIDIKPKSNRNEQTFRVVCSKTMSRKQKCPKATKHMPTAELAREAWVRLIAAANAGSAQRESRT